MIREEELEALDRDEAELRAAEEEGYSREERERPVERAGLEDELEDEPEDDREVTPVLREDAPLEG